jgi:hypothetical protein
MSSGGGVGGCGCGMGARLSHTSAFCRILAYVSIKDAEAKIQPWIKFARFMAGL